jgi:hypothetical protein
LIPEEILEVQEKRLRKDIPIEDATWENEQVVHETGLKLLEDKKFIAGETIMYPTS